MTEVTRNLKCFSCGEMGHLSADCEQKLDPNNPQAMKCFNCGQAGHSMKECQKEVDAKSLQSVKCYNCEEMGHFGKDCPKPSIKREPSMIRRGRARDNGCFFCGEEGHVKQDCPKAGGDGGSGRGGAGGMRRGYEAEERSWKKFMAGTEREVEVPDQAE